MKLGDATMPQFVWALFAYSSESHRRRRKWDAATYALDREALPNDDEWLIPGLGLIADAPRKVYLRRLDPDNREAVLYAARHNQSKYESSK